MGYSLRPYQLSGIASQIRHLTTNNQGAVVFATGSGKTDVGTIIGSELLHNGVVNKVIAATPFTSIVVDFASKSGDHFTTLAPNNRQFNIHKIDNYFNDDDNNDKVKTATINNIINAIYSKDKSFIVSTHAAIASNKIIEEINSFTNLSDMLLIIDEAHHCYFSDDDDETQTTEYKHSTKLGELAKSMLARGAKVLYLTATPYRTVGTKTELIFDSTECHPVIRTLGEQMKDGYSPRVKTEYIQVDYTLAGKHNMFGDTPSSKIDETQLRTVLPVIGEAYVNDDYPKSIWLIPAGNAEDSSIIVKQWIEENITLPEHIQRVRGRKTPNVLIAIGKDKKGILEALGSDKKSGGRQYDIVLGCRKFDEGTDVPTASHLYMIGLPSNVRLFHQRVGRVTRMKGAVSGYSEWFGDKYLDNSKVVFIAPVKVKNGKQAKVKEFDYNVSKQLLHCIFAAESYAEYCEATNINHSIRMAFEKLECEADIQSKNDTKEQIKALFSELELTMVKNDSTNEFEVLTGLALNPHETIGDKYRQLKASDLSIDEKREAYGLLLNHLPEEVKASEGFQNLITKMVSKMVTDTKRLEKRCTDVPDIKMAPYSIMCNEFEQIIEQYQECEINSDSYNAINKVFTELTAESISEWADKCGYLLGEEHHKKTALIVIDYYKKYNKYPSIVDSNYEIRKLGMWLSNARQEYATRYPILNKLAVDANIPDMFTIWDADTHQLKNCEELISYINENGKTPTQQDPIPEVRSLGKWLMGMKKIINGDADVSYRQLLLDYVSEAGFPTIFDYGDRNKIAKDKCEAVCQFYIDNGRLPSENNKDENQLRVFLTKIRGYWHNNKHDQLHQSIYDTLNKYNLMHLLTNTNTDRDINIIREYCTYINTHSKIPTYHGKNTLSLRRVFDRIYETVRDNLESDFSILAIKTANELGHPNIFDDKYNGMDVNDFKVHEIFKYHKENGRLPRSCNCEDDEKKLGQRLLNIRGDVRSGVIIPQSYYDIAKSYGFDDNVFKSTTKTDLEMQAYKRAEEICLFRIKHGRYPKTKPKTTNEAEYAYESKLAGQHGTLRKARDNKKGGSNWYSICDTLMEKYNLPDLYSPIDRKKNKV